jgi:hypothetical protein
MTPCASCVDTATPCPCPAFLAWAPPEPDVCLVCVDVEHLRLAGELLEQIAPRILDARGKPFRLVSLERHLAKHGRHDLVRQAVAS